MRLHELLVSAEISAPISELPNPTITGIGEDSRLIQAGELFVARGGVHADGARFVRQAIQRGAAAVVGCQTWPDCPVPQISVLDPAAALSQLANAFYNHPSRSIKVLGVTGTNGKTTITYLLRHVLHKYQIRCGLIGTVRTDDGRQEADAHWTTPPAVQTAQLLAAMRDYGCQACAMETSSQALHQGRVAGVRFAAGIFTNLTGDHLNYHQSMEEYARCKAMLFNSLSPGAPAIVNGADAWSERLVKNCRGKVIRFGMENSFDWRADQIDINQTGSRFRLSGPDGSAQVSMRLIGLYNIENALAAAAALGEGFGLPAQAIADGLADAAGAPGRLQQVDEGQDFSVLVDYAHTDDALQNVLAALRPLARGLLRVLFGCGGERDQSKRPRMAKTAHDLADMVYITSDNPRGENPQTIVDEILTGIPAGPMGKVVVELDRAKAIRLAIEQARPGDIVVLAGKGHENYQIFNGQTRHFDDVEEAVAALRGRRGGARSISASAGRQA